VRRACIDIGSNTTRLLVADCDGGQLAPCAERRAYTRIGAVAGAGADIPAAKLEEVAAVVAEQAELARQLGAEDVHCIATAAVRRARNGHELSELIAARTGGIRMRIVSGEEEARLAFLGAVRTAADSEQVTKAGQGPIAVADVGGGSSELVVGALGAGVSWWRSLPLGSSDLTGLYFHAERPQPAEIEQAREHVRLALEDLHPPAVKAALAVGGSGTSLRRLAGPVLDVTALRGALHLLAGTDPDEIANRSGLELERIHLLPAGLLILEGFVKLLATPLVVASGGIREGVLMDAEARDLRS
jgi:exopolyphosphatase / guanosine-5'-triphosphate,3'-diphosphate pyrophosphatase